MFSSVCFCFNVFVSLIRFVDHFDWIDCILFVMWVVCFFLFFFCLQLTFVLSLSVCLCLSVFRPLSWNFRGGGGGRGEEGGVHVYG